MVFAMSETLCCARSGCMPCRAKILINAGELGPVPSARPETCPRIARPPPQRGGGGARAARIGLYRRGQRILTVGDGDFTFSLALARALGGRVVATSHESLHSLRAVYGQACMDSIAELKQLGCEVAHGVDAADLAAALPARCRPADGMGTFDVVVWNFPCVVRDAAGAVLEQAGGGADARGSAELAQNRELVARFVASAASECNAHGEVHITHKVGLQQWCIEQQGSHATDGRNAANHASDGGTPALRYAGAVVFDRSAYPPYRPRKALASKSFPIADAQTFVFSRELERDHGLDEEEGRGLVRLTSVAQARAEMGV
jgi:25S rRNA (uracil2634-N3)-methyltransferase